MTKSRHRSFLKSISPHSIVYCLKHLHVLAVAGCTGYLTMLSGNKNTVSLLKERPDHIPCNAQLAAIVWWSTSLEKLGSVNENSEPPLQSKPPTNRDKWQSLWNNLQMEGWSLVRCVSHVRQKPKGGKAWLLFRLHCSRVPDGAISAPTVVTQLFQECSCWWV